MGLLTTGQFPQRRETDEQAEARVRGIEERRKELEVYQGAQRALFADHLRLSQIRRRVQRVQEQMRQRRAA